MMAKKRNRMTTYREAKLRKVQHTTPCIDCPFSRRAIPGWLAGKTPEEYCFIAHSDDVVECHTTSTGMQCAGLAIYRANVCKRALPPSIRLPADKENVFASPMEFLSHHHERRLTIEEMQAGMIEARNKRISLAMEEEE
jgi:hypothetical protein